jgi:hypothetical protein
VKSDLVLVEGVMKGATAFGECGFGGIGVLLPLEAVRFGVANAGDATTTRADTKTSATSTLPLIDLIALGSPFILTASLAAWGWIRVQKNR